MKPYAKQTSDPGREIQGVERRLKWAFVAILSLCLIILGLAVHVLLKWRDSSTVAIAVTSAVALSSLIITLYAFDSLHRASRSVRERLEALTFIDEATGVYNYRYLELRLREEMERVRRYGGSTAVLYLDLDRFKHVNDRFGHQLGNVVLGEIAQLMARSIRGCDIVGRMGGDEFLVILPDTDASKAKVLGDRMVQAVHDYTHETDGGVAIDFLSLKGGVAAYPANGRSMDQVIQAADDAVYEAKARGGSCVCVAQGTAPQTFTDRGPAGSEPR